VEVVGIKHVENHVGEVGSKEIALVRILMGKGKDGGYKGDAPPLQQKRVRPHPGYRKLDEV